MSDLTYFNVLSENSTYNVLTGEIGDINVVNGTKFETYIEMISDGGITIEFLGKRAIDLVFDESDSNFPEGDKILYGREEEYGDSLISDRGSTVVVLDNLIKVISKGSKAEISSAIKIFEGFESWFDFLKYNIEEDVYLNRMHGYKDMDLFEENLPDFKQLATNGKIVINGEEVKLS